MVGELIETPALFLGRDLPKEAAFQRSSGSRKIASFDPKRPSVFQKGQTVDEPMEWLAALMLLMLTLMTICLFRINAVVTTGVNQIVSGLQAIYDERRKDA